MFNFIKKHIQPLFELMAKLSGKKIIEIDTQAEQHTKSKRHILINGGIVILLFALLVIADWIVRAFLLS